MENIKNTTKYFKAIKIILISAFLITISPMVVSAQLSIDPIPGGTIGMHEIGSSGGGSDGFGEMSIWNPYGFYNPGNQSYDGSVMNFDVQSYNLVPYTINDWDTTGIYNSGNNNFTAVDSNASMAKFDTLVSNNNVTSGSYSGNGVGSYGGYGSYYPYSYGSGWVSSGGYSGGANTYVAPTRYSVPGSASVISGSYVAGTSTYAVPSTYYIQDTSNVYSGGYSNGNNYSVSPSNYYIPQTSTVTSGSYSEVGLTSQVVPNQVLAYTDTNPTLDSVYLSDIPNTGFEDYYGTLVFISVLVSWSAILAYIFLNRKIKSQTVSAVVYVNKNEKNEIDGSVTSNLLKKITSDKSDIGKVEEYARRNKVLLSSDASAKIVKLSRLGQIDATEYIKGLAKGEWVAIGENQIQ